MKEILQRNDLTGDNKDKLLIRLRETVRKKTYLSPIKRDQLELRIAKESEKRIKNSITVTHNLQNDIRQLEVNIANKEYHEKINKFKAKVKSAHKRLKKSKKYDPNNLRIAMASYRGPDPFYKLTDKEITQMENKIKTEVKKSFERLREEDKGTRFSTNQSINDLKFLINTTKIKKTMYDNGRSENEIESSKSLFRRDKKSLIESLNTKDLNKRQKAAKLAFEAMERYRQDNNDPTLMSYIKRQIKSELKEEKAKKSMANVIDNVAAKKGIESQKLNVGDYSQPLKLDKNLVVEALNNIVPPIRRGYTGFNEKLSNSKRELSKFIEGDSSEIVKPKGLSSGNTELKKNVPNRNERRRTTLLNNNTRAQIVFHALKAYSDQTGPNIQPLINIFNDILKNVKDDKIKLFINNSPISTGTEKNSGSPSTVNTSQGSNLGLAASLGLGGLGY